MGPKLVNDANEVEAKKEMAFLPPGTMFLVPCMLAKITSSRLVLPVWEDAQLRVGHHVDMWRRAERDKL